MNHIFFERDETYRDLVGWLELRHEDGYGVSTIWFPNSRAKVHANQVEIVAGLGRGALDAFTR